MIFSDSANLQNDLKDKVLLFDTNALIGAVNNPEFLDYLYDLQKKGCVFITISTVAMEFSRTDDISKFNKRNKFLKEFLAVYPIEKQVGPTDPIVFLLNKCAPSCGYADFLLYFALNKFPTSFLISENHKDFHLSVLDRKHVITLDSGKNTIRNYGLYQISKQKLDSAAQNILSS